MTSTEKDKIKNSLYLLPLFLFCSFNLFEVVATASTKRGSSADAQKTTLRGEIWYGNASWYGSKFHGKRTSSGEKYNKRKLTAAHQSLPFNTKVIVTNLENNKTVVVRINDRGPFVGDRIIDLSEEAAEKIDAKKQGIAYIKLQVITPLVESNKSNNKIDGEG